MSKETKKYRVRCSAHTRIEYFAYVEATSEDEAKRIAENGGPDEVDDHHYDPIEVGMLDHIAAREAEER